MEKIEKTVFLVVGNNRESEYKTLDEAQNAKNFLDDFFENKIVFNIESRQKTEYKIEKGDKVHWVKNNIIDTTRIDEIVDIIEDLWSDTKYKTKEVNGNKIGIACKKDLFLII